MEETDIHDALDVDSAATLAVTANQVKAELRRASANIPNHNDNIPNVVNYLSQKRIKWKHSHDKIMIVTKAKDYQLLRYTRGLAQWLITKSRFGKRYPFTVYVDGHLKDEKNFKYQELCEKNPIFKEKLQFWTPKLCHENPSMFHLIITLGGDGTVLFTSWLFQTIVPPVMSFHLGSLNFLAPFPYDHHKEALNDLFEGENGFRTTVRMRLSCTVYRVACQEEEKIQDMLLNEEKVAQHKKKHPHEKMTSSVMLETAWMKKQLLQSGSNQEGLSKEERQYLKKAVPCYTTIPCETYEVLNELVVDRGPSSYMSMLELFGDERHLTTVQADGLVIATPTGSTAYSLSAHGSLTHPDIRATLVTPICPHTLSFRPMLLPETMSIRVVVPFGSSKSAYCSFDGRNRVELRSGDHVKITMSPYPFPTVCRTESSDDWFSSLQSSLQWNVRQRQSFVILESDKENKGTDEKEKVSGTNNMLACLKEEEHEDDNESATYDEQKDNDDGEIYTLTDEEDNDIDNEENRYQGIPMWGSDELKL